MKTEDRSSAVQYAHAIMQLTDESGTAQSVLANMQTMQKVFAESPDLMVLFKHPAIAAPEKIRFLKECCAGLDELASRLLELLCERRKLHLLGEIVSQFEELLREKKGILSGTLTSAESMSEDAVRRIRTSLSQRYSKEVQLQVEVDKSLIGGHVLRIGDQVIDGSLKGRLHAVEKALLSV